MPANLTPEYMAAEARFKAAREPIILKEGSTVSTMARTIHKELENKLKFARIWSDRHFDGQRIPRDEVLQDRDIIEINA